MKLHLFLLFIIAFCMQVQAQDTLCSGTILDTLVAREYLNRSKTAWDHNDYSKAYTYALQSRQIYEQYTGQQSWDYGVATYHLATATMNLGDHTKAEQYLRTTLSTLVAAAGENNKYVSDTYEALGACIRDARPSESIALFKKSLAIRTTLFGENDTRLAPSYLNLGGAYQIMGNWQEARRYYERCIETGADDPMTLGRAYRNLSGIFSNTGDKPKAREYVQKAIQLQSSYNLYEDLIQSYTASCYLEAELGHCKEGIQDGLRGLQTIDQSGIKHGILDVQMYHALGNAYLCKEDFEQAQQSFTQCYNMLKQTDGPNSPLLAIPLNSLATSCATGPAHAQEYLLEALDIFKKNKQEADCVTLGNLAECYFIQKNFHKAIEYGKKALETAKRNPLLKHQEIMQLSVNLGNYYLENNQPDASLPHYELAEKMYRNTHREPDDYLALLWYNEGNCLYRQNNLEEATTLLLQSLNLLEKTGKNQKAKNAVLTCLAQIETQKTNWNKAIQYADAAVLSSADHIGQQDVEIFIDALLLKGKIYRALYEASHDALALEQARIAFDEADKTLQNAIDHCFRDLDQFLLLQRSEEIAEQRIQVACKQNGLHSTFAFEISEQAKARLLHAAFQNSKAQKIAGVPDSLLRAEHDIEVEIARCESNFYHSGKSTPPAPSGEATGNIFDLRLQRDRLIAHIGTLYPAYQQLKYERNYETVEAVQQKRLHPGQTLLEYFTGDSSIFIFVVQPNHYEIVEVKRDFPLEDWVHEMRSGITDWYAGKMQNMDYQASVQLYASAAHQLYTKLVAPVAALLTPGAPVMVVPHGVLINVPFEALLTQMPTRPDDLTRYDYWLMEHNISYCYSASLLAEMQDRTHAHPPTGLFLGVAPAYNSSMSAATFGSNRQRFRPLDYNQPEVDTIRKMIGGEVLAGTDATKKRFVDTALYFRILHLALHGEANDRFGNYSYLAFYEKQDTDAAHVCLFASEVYNLRLYADLVVLSACQSGQGELQQGEGIIGLTRAFAFAGAKSIVHSIWSIEDNKTMILMTAFYQNLKAGQAKDTALANAKRSFILDGGDGREHPVFWAGFIGVGDMQAIDLK